MENYPVIKFYNCHLVAINFFLYCVYMIWIRNRIMSFRQCIHCGREYEDIFDKPICSNEC